MKIFCEYCGVQIDVNKNNKCPNCGASFSNNVTYKEYKKKHEELDFKEREISIENKKVVHENIRNITGTVKNFSKVFVIIFVFIFIFFIAIFSFFIFKIFKSSENISNNKESVKENLDVLDDFFNTNEVDVVVGMKEYAETSEYKVMVDYFEEVDVDHQKPKTGYKYVTFHFILENKMNDKLFLFETIDCVVDGIAQSDVVDFDRESLPSLISKGLTVQGYKTFEIPDDTRECSIKFGNNVTININIQ